MAKKKTPTPPTEPTPTPDTATEAFRHALGMADANAVEAFRVAAQDLGQSAMTVRDALREAIASSKGLGSFSTIEAGIFTGTHLPAGTLVARTQWAGVGEDKSTKDGPYMTIATSRLGNGTANEADHPESYPLLRYLATVAYLIRNKGWISDTRGKREGLAPTYLRAWQGMGALVRPDQIPAEDYQAAQDVLEWNRARNASQGALPPMSADQRGYFDRLAMILFMPEIQFKHAAFAASSYRAIEKLAAHAGAPSIAMGTVVLPDQGPLIEHGATVATIHSVEYRYLIDGRPVTVARVIDAGGLPIHAYPLYMIGAHVPVEQGSWFRFAIGYEYRPTDLMLTWVEHITVAPDQETSTLIVSPSADVISLDFSDRHLAFRIPRGEEPPLYVYRGPEFQYRMGLSQHHSVQGLLAGASYRITGRYLPDMGVIDHVSEIFLLDMPKHRDVLWD